MKLKGRFKVIGILKKTTSKHWFWHNLKADDIIEVCYVFQHLHRNSNGLHAPTISFTNLRTQDEYSSTINLAYNSLSKIEYEVIND